MDANQNQDCQLLTCEQANHINGIPLHDYHCLDAQPSQFQGFTRVVCLGDYITPNIGVGAPTFYVVVCYFNGEGGCVICVRCRLQHDPSTEHNDPSFGPTLNMLADQAEIANNDEIRAALGL